MKKGLVILVIALLAGITAFWLMRSQKQADRGVNLIDSMPELTWMEKELGLSDEQLAKVSALHTAYRPECDRMCGLIADSGEKVAKLASAGREVSPELEAAIREHAQVEADCRKAMVAHLYRTAAALNPDQASRYLDAMLPYALDTAPTQGANSHAH